jgi:hypothetical protein
MKPGTVNGKLKRWNGNHFLVFYNRLGGNPEPAPVITAIRFLSFKFLYLLKYLNNSQ